MRQPDPSRGAFFDEATRLLILIDALQPDAPLVACISYDERPGIQAVGTTAPDRLPVPGVHAAAGRDHEYVRHGTVTLMAGMDLVAGHVHRAVVDRHRSREFVEFLRTLDEAYPEDVTRRLILDNHSAHISRETRAYLASVPNRFEFVFTPKHASWLNLIETFSARRPGPFCAASASPPESMNVNLETV